MEDSTFFSILFLFVSSVVSILWNEFKVASYLHIYNFSQQNEMKLFTDFSHMVQT